MPTLIGRERVYDYFEMLALRARRELPPNCAKNATCRRLIMYLLACTDKALLPAAALREHFDGKTSDALATPAS